MDQTANILAVDSDAVSRRFLERALGQDKKPAEFSLECARDAAAAFEVLRNTLCDVIVCDTELPDMNGLRFLTLLRGERRYKNVPFLFLSADTRTSTRVAALNAGAEDCLEKPCDPEVLLARLRRLVREQRTARTEGQNRAYEIAGEFSVLPLPDIVSLLELSQKSGMLRLTTPRASGEIVFEKGAIWSATFGTLIGPAAFYRMLSEHEGRYEFVVGEGAAAVRTVFETATALILEGARLLDESGTARALSPGSSRVLNPNPSTERSEPLFHTPALTPSTQTADQFIAGINDEFNLGELKLFTYDELTRWTRADLARERLHVQVIADVANGVSALLSMAGPPTEHWVIASLRAEPKVLGISFVLRGGRQLDVLLVEPKDAMAVGEALRRKAAFTIVAPRDGDMVAIGAQTRALIDRFLDKTRPDMVLGVGTSALQQHMVELDAVEEHSIPVRCVRGVLGDGRCELRGVLVEGLRRWGALGEERRRGGKP
jgi:DNA-binding response OmpR family regulator